MQVGIYVYKALDQRYVCVYVCMYVCLFVCLSAHNSGTGRAIVSKFLG